MLGKKNVKKELERFRRGVVRDARKNFTSMGKNSSGRGSRSIGSRLEVGKGSFDLDFDMERYMEFQDKGVSGTKKKYNTPYNYTNKRPPASAFDKWTIRRGIAGRDEQGRFLSRKSLNYAIATSIFKYGIKPSLFFTSAFEKHFKTLPKELIEAYALDIEDLMEFTLDAR